VGGSRIGLQPLLEGSHVGLQPLLGGSRVGLQPLLGGSHVGLQPLLGGSRVGLQPLLGGSRVGLQPLLGGSRVGAQPLLGGSRVGAQPLLGGSHVGLQPLLASERTVTVYFNLFCEQKQRINCRLTWWFCDIMRRQHDVSEEHTAGSSLGLLLQPEEAGDISSLSWDVLYRTGRNDPETRAPTA
jgi:hypothetical protein